MTTHHRIITVAAATLALGAGAAPALARPYDLNGNGSSVPAGPVAAVPPTTPTSSGQSSTSGQPGPPILPGPNPSQRAAIQQAERRQSNEFSQRLPLTARYSNAEMNAYRSGPATVRVIAPKGGFDWGDAGIGAAGGLALSLLGIGTAMAVSQRRTRRTATALTS